MTVAVIGAGGQLGAELCRRFSPDVVGLDLPDFDVTDRAEVVLRLVDLEPELVVNAAGYTRVDQAETEPEAAMAVNALAVGYLADACRALDCPLVHVSTDYVFGGDASRTTPYRETDPPAPLGIYARSKLEGERRAAAWTKHFLVRTSGLYGARAPRSREHFVAKMLRQGRLGRPVRVVRDQHCTPSYVPHVARAIHYLAGTTAWGTYHVVNAGATTWYEFAQEVFRLCGMTVELEGIRSEEYPAAALRPLNSVLDTSKYHALSGAPAMPTWKEALAEYLSAGQV